MSDIIQFAKTAQYLGQSGILANSNSMVSGMSVSEASRALGLAKTGNLQTALQFNQNGSNAILKFPQAQSALDAAQAFKNTGGFTTDVGAAVSGSGAVNAGTVGLAKISGQVSTVGVATGGAGIAAAACAPLFGVAAGAGLYSLAPDFWETVSRALLPWCYENTDVLPLVFDENGQTYLPQAMIEALRSVLPQIGERMVIDTTGTELASPFMMATFPNPYTFGNYSYDLGEHVTQITAARCGNLTLYISDGPGSSRVTAPGGVIAETLTCETREINGQILYGGYYLGGQAFTELVIERAGQSAEQSNVDANQLLWYMQYGSISPYLPEGFEEWQGDTYPSNPEVIEMYTGDDAYGNPQFENYQRVALPIGDPLTTNNPTIQPSPYTNPPFEIDPDTGDEIYPAIDPYISPFPSPNFFPIPNEIPEGQPGHIGEPDLNPAPLPSTEAVPQTQPAPAPQVNPALDPATVPVSVPVPAPAGSTGISNFPTLPVFPLFPDSSAGLYHVYNPTEAQLQSFGSWLWTTFSGNLIDTLSKLFNNPMDAVISLQEFYGTPNIQGSGTIRCGYLDSEIPSALVGGRYNSINCGTIVIPEYYSNYLDYAPYTQVIIYLPFIGFMSLNADDIIGNAVQVVYHVDSYTGSVIAIITVARNGYQSVVYQYEGNCSVDIPVTGGQQSSIKGAIIGGISGAVAGGVAGAAVGAVLGGLSTKNDVQHSGSFSASYGAMGAKKPFIVVRRPVQKVVYNYSESYGYPAHKMVNVGNCRGYLRAREVRVLSTTATNEEKEMIVRALKDGIYVKN